VSALEERFQARVWRGRGRKLDFSCILSLNPYQSEVNNMLQMINSSNFMFDEWLCKVMIMWSCGFMLLFMGIMHIMFEPC
jgi:hypothetical protein